MTYYLATRWIVLDTDTTLTPTGDAGGTGATEVFDDVRAALEDWAGREIGIVAFSATPAAEQGAALAQTSDGDLRELFTHYLDHERVGADNDEQSYRNIAELLEDPPPSEILYLSAAPEKLDAAREAGWTVFGVTRDGEPSADTDFDTHQTVSSFSELAIEAEA